MTTVADTGSAADAGLARRLADEAGRELLRIRAESGLTGTALKDAGDAGAQVVLAHRLSQERPGDAVLSEEARGDDAQQAALTAARLASRRVWIIDPLDGTREFSEPGRSDWAVHVALWQDGELTAGAVALPALGLCYATDAPPTSQDRAAGEAGQPLRLAVSRTRPPAFVQELAERLGAVAVPMGSAGVKCASVWRAESDAYVHAGGQYEWDSAAPVAVARAAGLHTSRIDGSALEYNRPDPLLPDLVVAQPWCAGPILEHLAAMSSAPSTEVTTR